LYLLNNNRSAAAKQSKGTEGNGKARDKKRRMREKMIGSEAAKSLIDYEKNDVEGRWLVNGETE
jgi:hypothetical protein